MPRSGPRRNKGAVAAEATSESVVSLHNVAVLAVVLALVGLIVRAVRRRRLAQARYATLGAAEFD